MVAVGDVLSQRYKLERFIGSGGTATVYLAKDLILDRQVAVKILRYDFYNDEKTLKRFQREARAVSELVHENIVELYDVDDDGQNRYLVMEHVDGTDLKQYIREHYPLSLVEVVNIMTQVVNAVSVAHHKGIIHRDLKTQNILIRKDGVIKITDFGIAIGLSDTAVTQTNTLVGSIHYLSPEQSRGGSATNQSDIYALGIILYELIMGEVPFNGDSAVSIAMKHFQSPMPSIVENAVQTVPQSLENVLLRATTKNPKYRYPSCTSMLQDLRTCLKLSRQNEKKFIEPSGKPVVKQPSNVSGNVVVKPKTPPSKPTFKPQKKKSKKGFVLFAMLFAALLVIGAGTMFLLANRPKDVQVPEVVGKTEVDATKLLADIGLIVEKVEKEKSDTVKEGMAIKTDPKSNTVVKQNSKVILYVSSGENMETFEDYTNKEYSAIYTELIKKGYIIERKTEASATVKAGYIISQSIQSGTKVTPKGTVVTFTVSSGEITFENYTNQLFETVKGKLVSEGFNVTKEEVHSNTVKEGYIVDQSITAGTKVNPTQTSVKFFVSIGKKEITMPNLYGSSKEFVENQLSDLGVTYILKQEYSENPVGTVIQQSIPAGSVIKEGVEVTITISRGKQNQTTTTETTTETTRRRY
ncbi:Stk1 family PASTA domain-containing Ser/Thr kinase [Granulicatella sp. zg-ZJ]|uniref:Stk1 family PASTA domain-containing Ser/Thr kinase n=1 Tax=unclassified Granulicatella TaxID=2630493 RepID=UPI0013BEC8B4|nr:MULTISPECIES: Stk1 family PASTA domain-containing Ser/Thr kinase [unclassified Granulicatella]MBS4750956.1 Stk1 family PASTA domain-containing Ser/Thr kinase [Carnobacteriaceae bacterium zg-ZUI78]NEW62179.1 Stk1 family PASTA domain-containing Ser/Thr kinase [Granulicatella sp. zg-ZJ]NEW66623.1 Stk1 family PASTA domain-containing Ser/Thr kinase [Granulicatella sp. zg-84]QMI85054.1 Stk1 family PASTA domain-containing Ser/Thr kinase [Carnobacteriaceae bacterium zg-84]